MQVPCWQRSSEAKNGKEALELIKELKQKMDNGDDFQLIDVRESHERAFTNIGGDRPKTLPEFYRKLWSLGAAGIKVPLDIQRDGKSNRGYRDVTLLRKDDNR